MKKHVFSAGLIMLLVAGQFSAQEFVSKRNLDSNGRVDLITFNGGLSSKSTNINEILKQSLNLDSRSSLQSIKTDLDPSSSFVDEKFQLYYDGIKVQYVVYTTHSQNGKIESLSGNMFPITDVTTKPALSATSALNSAVKHTGAQKYMWEDAQYVKENSYKKPDGELVLIPIEQNDGSFKLLLAYKFDIYAAQPLSREYVYVDALDGKILMTDSIIKHAKNFYGEASASHQENSEHHSEAANTKLALVNGTAATRYSGSQTIATTLVGSNYTLRDSSRGNGVFTYNLRKGTALTSTDFTDADNNWTAAEFNNAAFDNAALDAHWGVSSTYDYFKNTFNRNSYNNAGAALKSYIHYSSAYENAYWSGSEMVYGDGASTFSPLTSLDVTAHELGHAVCEYSANLVYSRESGAINEGLSDIWGSVVENAFAPTKQNFLIGEDITKTSPGYLRSMSNPKSGLSAQPDTYLGINWKAATSSCTPSQANDQCGVHYNSGVLNHFFYILTQGKTGTNDKGNSYSVTGIGFDKSAKIVYRMETSYLTSTSTYANVLTYAIQSAKDLYGVGSPEAIATQNALYAVGLGTAYTGGTTADTTAPSAPANLSASGTTSVATNLTWTASTDNVAVTGYNVYNGATLLGTTATTTYSVAGLTASTTYSFSVKAKDAAGNISASSNVLSVTTSSTTTPPVAYCASKGNSTSDEKIGKVVFGTINNTSTGTAGYENFTAQIANVNKGTAYTITITPKWTSTTYNEGYAVFIDYNADGDFADAGETVFTKAASKTTPVSGSITIPATALTGNTRMRVSMKYNGIPTSCEAFSYGQVEDYTLNIKAAGTVASLAGANVETAVNVYPNPVKNVLNINAKGDYNYQLISTDGKIIKDGNQSESTINVQNLPTGMYIMKITQGGKTSSHKVIKK